ncbi:MAG: GNAT family N-acetyltransferase [Candidatus Daviesbacteria bacterium]|nr:GNAT family N-acetyltransferase [Candidatus Daviesbacteria bacterium]
MSKGLVVFNGKTEKGLDILVRYPNSDDGQILCDYINTLSKEKTFILFQGEQVKLDEEQKYLELQLKNIERNKSVLLLAFYNNSLIGVTSIEGKDKAEKHIASFGISIAQGFRAKGVGKLFMDLIIKEAEQNLKGLKIILLSVFGDNEVAKSLYNKFGFQEFGSLPGGILHAGKPVDHIYMYKKVD